MIKVYVFKKDGVRIVKLDNLKSHRMIDWIDVINPTKEEKKKLSKTFGIPIADINNSLDPEERARVENNEEYSLIIFKVPAHKKKQISTTSLGIIISKKVIITIRATRIESLEKLAKEIDKTLVHKQRYQYLFSQILLGVTRDFYDVIEELGQGVDKLENKLIKGATSVKLEKVFAAKKVLLYFRKALITNRDVLIFLEKGGSPFVNKKSDIDDLRQENLQLLDTEELLRGRLSETMNLYLSSVSNNLNISMKYFAVIAALFLLPMLISGAYGMNFKVLPLAYNPYGFWIMIGMMLVAMMGMFFYFRRKDWI